MNYVKKAEKSEMLESDLENYIEQYENGFFKLTEEIEPKSVMCLDTDLLKSMQKMEMVAEILKNLPGIDCGVCGSPTCRAFAEDIVKGGDNKAVCIVKTMEGFKNRKI